MIIHELKILYNGYIENREAKRLNHPVPYPECITPYDRISLIRVEIDGREYRSKFLTTNNEILTYAPFSNESSPEFRNYVFDCLLNEVTKLVQYDIETEMKKKLGDSIV